MLQRYTDGLANKRAFVLQLGAAWNENDCSRLERVAHSSEVEPKAAIMCFDFERKLQ
jgi:hypothetical protein